jgi:hypothetical protein
MKKSELLAALAKIPGDPEIMVAGYEDGYERLGMLWWTYVDLANPNSAAHCREFYVGTYQDGKPTAPGVELVLVMQAGPNE